MQITKLPYANPQYPRLLREITNPPKWLFVSGPMPDIPLVAIVGSRRPTDYGRQVTYRLASELAAGGIGIVSGLAIGIDAVAHQAAIEAGGFTLAVLGSGLNQIYPLRNRPLASKLLGAGGVIMTEQEADMPPLKHHFPARNRIIAGLARAVVVTEAAAGSGSLITATFALDENRLVMAVPGNVTSLASVGTNKLLRAGAVPITSATDVLEALNLDRQLPSRPPPTPQNAEEAAILELIAQGITTSRELIEHSALSAARFAHIISLMEITGKVRNLGAGTWVQC
jgi:DNA processing protein